MSQSTPFADGRENYFVLGNGVDYRNPVAGPSGTAATSGFGQGAGVFGGSGELAVGAEGEPGGETPWSLTGFSYCSSSGAGSTGMVRSCIGSSCCCSGGACSTGMGWVGEVWTGYSRDFNLVFAFGGVGRGVWVGAVLVIGVKLLRNLRFLSVTLPVPSTRTVYWSWSLASTTLPVLSQRLGWFPT